MQENEPKSTDGIARIESYVNGLSQEVTVCVPLAPGEARTYQGHGVLGQRGPQGAVGVPFTFPIEADSLQQAFERFKESGDAAIRELTKPRIQVARLAPTPGNGGKRFG